MKYKISIFIIATLLQYKIFASESLMPIDTAYKKVTDTIKLKAEIVKSSKNLKTIDADFVQEKNMSILTEPVTSKGHFYFKNNTMIRWEYKTPFQYIIVINNGKLSIKDNSKVNTYDMTANSAFAQINSKLGGIIQGDIINDNKDFKINYYENNNNYLLKLTPLNGNLKSFFKEIDIYLNKSDFLLSTLNMIELSGDYTKIEFINRKNNTEISDDVFVIK